MTGFFEEVGELALGSRLKVLSERLYDAVDVVYRARGSRFEGRWFPVMRLLRDRGPLSVTEIAREVGLTHAAVSQLADRLVRDGWLTGRADAGDARRRCLELTPHAQTELRGLAPVWRAVREAIAARDGAAELMSALERLGGSLSSKPLEDEVAARTAALESRAVRVVPYSRKWKQHFYRINAAWLQKHFYLEKIDHRVLSDPEGEIITPGGAVLFALVGDEVVGTCALKLDGPGRYELTKMGVDEERRGLGIGRKLIEAAIAEFRRRRGRELFLESNSRLGPALRLYESVGFAHTPRPAPSSYQRSDVYMVYAPKKEMKPPGKRRRARTVSSRGRASAS